MTGRPAEVLKIGPEAELRLYQFFRYVVTGVILINFSAVCLICLYLIISLTFSEIRFMTVIIKFVFLFLNNCFLHLP